MMVKKRFFATLHYARKLNKHNDKVLLRLMLTQFMYALPADGKPIHGITFQLCSNLTLNERQQGYERQSADKVHQ